MPNLTKPKIAYLFGAGATHAEVANFEEADEVFLFENGLRISDVSQRVMEQVQHDSTFKTDVESVTSRKGSLNIELIISLFETNRIPNAEYKITKLKDLVESDITGVLSQPFRQNFYLHKGLMELHELIQEKEELIGIISLNYDDLLDEAYHEIKQMTPTYCLTSECEDGVPLLKLHGSFNWKELELYGQKRTIQIVPLGINKNYLTPPYNFIWGRAFELLVECDILRIIGCSLSQNDIGLIDLLFKAHLERGNGRELEMQIIDFEDPARYVKNNYGFFPGLIEPRNIEAPLLYNESLKDTSQNPFKIWLRAKGDKMLDEEMDNTTYLKKCLEQT